VKIAILGGRRVGSSLAATWRSAGHDVTVSTRTRHSPEAAAAGNVLLAAEAFARLVIGIAYSRAKGPFVYRFENA
jgi:predicted dinucleotide-binding enzyme